MNYITGSAVKLRSEVSVISGTTVTFDLYDPNGVQILDDTASSFETKNTSVAFATWQSTVNTHTAGRYKYISKAVNGAYTNQAKGFFYLEDE